MLYDSWGWLDKIDYRRDQQILSNRPYKPGESHDQLSKVTSDWQRARPSYQVDQGAIYICKEGVQSMNRDEGSYQLSHVHDRFLGTLSSSSRAKNRKN